MITHQVAGSRDGLLIAIALTNYHSRGASRTSLVQDTDLVTALDKTIAECVWGRVAWTITADDLHVVSVRGAWTPFVSADCSYILAIGTASAGLPIKKVNVLGAGGPSPSHRGFHTITGALYGADDKERNTTGNNRSDYVRLQLWAVLVCGN